jgi:lysophospholipase L1-like esterase
MKKLALALLSFFLALLSVEFATRVALNFHPMYAVEITRYGRDLKRRASNPDLSHEHRPNSKAWLYGTEIAINSIGLRNPEVQTNPSASSRRILALGDSLTLGWGVNADATYPAQLAGLLRAEVINAGVGNYNTDQERSYYENEGYKLGAQDVVLLYYVNDAEQTPLFRETSPWQYSHAFILLWDSLSKLSVQYGSKLDYLSYYRSLYAPEAPGWNKTKRALESLKISTSKNGARLYVAVCPELHRFKSETPLNEIHAEIIGYLRKAKIETIDLLPALRAAPESEDQLWVSKEDVHPNARGHEIIANEIAKRLRP